jgi:Secretion system C-terminal sorting domain
MKFSIIIFSLLFALFAQQTLCAQDIVLSFTQESVPGAANGQVLATIQDVGAGVTQNNPPFSFRLCKSNLPSNCIQVSNSTGIARFENLTSGYYCLYVTDKHNCSIIECFTLCPEKIFSEIKVTEPVQGPPTNLGIAEIIKLPNASTPFSWKLENPSNYNQSGSNNPIKFLEPYASPYSITVTDLNGCTQTQSFVVKKCAPAVHEWKAEIRQIRKPQTGCSNTGELEAVITNQGSGVAPFTFTWSNTNGFKATTVDNIAPYTSTITGLTVGSYKVTITDYNCSTKVLGPFLLTAANEGNMNISYTVSTGLGCSQYIDLTPTGGAAPYKVKWDNGAITEDIGPLLSNSNYGVTVTDKNGCSAIKVIPTGSPKQLAVSAVMVAACGGLKGSLSATVTDGKDPYTYAWNTGASTPFIDNLGVASYTLTVTDANGCTKMKTFMVTESLVVTGNILDVCVGFGFNKTGAITTTISGGVSPFIFQWNVGSTNQNLTNIAQGTFSVTVTDFRGCTGTKTFQVSNSYSTFSDYATTEGDISTIDGCALYGSCPGTENILVPSTHTQFIFEPNDPYCPCHGGGKLYCANDPNTILAIPTIGGGLDCQKLVREGCTAYLPIGGDLINMFIGDILQHVEPGFCLKTITCQFEAGFIPFLPSGYPIWIITKGINCCNGFKGNDDRNVTMAEKNKITIFPNPATDLLTIQGSGINVETIMKMYDSLGKLVFSTMKTIENNQNELKMDLSTIQSGGVYTVELWNGDMQIAQSKIIIIKSQ